VFFVLRKKEKQITFLHMYHHTVMPMISWACTKYYPGGHGTFIGVINSFVHIIMYFYYMMSAMGPQYQKYLWWKKYITTLQMVWSLHLTIILILYHVIVKYAVVRLIWYVSLRYFPSHHAAAHYVCTWYITCRFYEALPNMLSSSAVFGM